MTSDIFTRHTWHVPGRWRKIATGALLVAAVGGAALVTTRHALTRVTLDVGGQVWRYHTRAETVRDLLEEAKVTLEPEDIVSPSLSTPLSDGMTVTVQKARPVVLAVDGAVRQIRTNAAHPLDILAEQGITLSPWDEIQVNARTLSRATLAEQVWNVPPESVRVLRSATITIHDEDHTLTIHTTQVELGQALATAGLTLFLADRVEPDLNTPVTDGMTVRIERSLPITVIADGRQLQIRALGPTVGDALAMIGLAPVGRDYTLPPLEAPLEAHMVIRLVRVIEKP